MMWEKFWGKEGFFVGKKGIIVGEGVGNFVWFSFGKLRGILGVFLFLVGGGEDGDFFLNANKNLKGGGFL